MRVRGKTAFRHVTLPHRATWAKPRCATPAFHSRPGSSNGATAYFIEFRPQNNRNASMKPSFFPGLPIALPAIKDQ